MEHDLPPVRRAAMLEQVDALPSAKDKPPRGDRNGEPLAIFQRDRLEKPFQIRSDIGVRILLNKKRAVSKPVTIFSPADQAASCAVISTRLLPRV